MKKTLSLVLALAMAVSLVTFSTAGAGAATSFQDASSITYREAVDVISSLKIMEGYSDGTFQPNNNLTRGAASKIICSLALGATNAANLSKNASSYPDVGRGTTFAGYIAWCKENNIIGGYGDGTFRPSNPLTANAFLKMLLGIVGYDQNREGYTNNTNWSFNVQTQAQSSGLLNGLVGEFEGKDPVSRQIACLFSFNTLQADLVTYPSSTAKAAVVTWEAENAAALNINSEKATNGKVKIQFAEEHFKTLVKQDASDSFGRPANRWKLGTTVIGTYAAESSATYYDNVTAGDLYNALGLTETVQNTADTKSVSIFVNGVDVAAADAAIVKNGTKKLSAMVAAENAGDIGRGVEIRAFYSDGKVTVSVVPYYSGRITNVVSGTSTRSRSVTITPSAVKPADGPFSFETDAFEKDDVVAYTYSAKDKAVQDVVKLTLRGGKLTGKAVGSSVGVADTTYNYAKKIAFSGGLTDSGLKVGENYNVYTLALGGNHVVLLIDSGATDVEGYAIVTVADSNSVDGNRARLLKTDCSEITVTLDSKSDTVTTNDIVRFTTNADGTCNVKKIGAGELAKAESSSISNRAIANLKQGDNSVLLDDDTVFIIRDKNGTLDYEGNRNIPNIASGTAFAYVTGSTTKTAKIVFFFSKDTSTTTRTDLVFVAANSASTVKSDSVYSGYRTFNAVVGTKITTIDVKAHDVKVKEVIDSDGTERETILPGAVLDGGSMGGEGNVVLGVYESNNLQASQPSVIINSAEVYDNGIYSSALFVGSRGITTGHDTGLSAPSGGNLVFGGNSAHRYAMSDSLRVYRISKDGDITAIGKSDIVADAKADVYYTLDNSKEITNLYIVKTTDD